LKGWVPKKGKKATTAIDSEEEYRQLDEDELEIENQNKFESAFNFRFEEPNGTVIPNFPREVPGSIRRKDETRKLKRKRKQEKIHKEKIRKAERNKRAVQSRKQELKDKLKELKEISGIKSQLIETLELDKEFDPESYGKQMNQIFDEKFYEAEENEKPSLSSDEEPSTNKEAPSSQETQMKRDSGQTTQMKRDQEFRAGAKKIVEQYHNDKHLVNSSPFPFKYTEVPKNSYGLTPYELIVNDDSVLRKIVDSKMLAPYRSDEWSLPNSVYKQKKMNLAKQNMFICSTPEDNQVTSNKRKLEETSLEQEIDTILNKPRNKRKRKKRRKDKK